MLRFRAASFYAVSVDILGFLNANIINCVFRDNNNQFVGDTEVRSLWRACELVRHAVTP